MPNYSRPFASRSETKPEVLIRGILNHVSNSGTMNLVVTFVIDQDCGLFLRVIYAKSRQSSHKDPFLVRDLASIER
jgi:hypothetical protein